MLVTDEGGKALPRDEILRYAFVLAPLADVAGDELHPQLGERLPEPVGTICTRQSGGLAAVGESRLADGNRLGGRLRTAIDTYSDSEQTPDACHSAGGHIPAVYRRLFRSRHGRSAAAVGTDRRYTGLAGVRVCLCHGLLVRSRPGHRHAAGDAGTWLGAGSAARGRWPCRRPAVCLEAGVPAYLLRRAGIDPGLRHLRDALLFVVLGAVARPGVQRQRRQRRLHDTRRQ